MPSWQSNFNKNSVTAKLVSEIAVRPLQKLFAVWTRLWGLKKLLRGQVPVLWGLLSCASIWVTKVFYSYLPGAYTNSWTDLIFNWPVNPTYVQLSEANSPRMLDLLVRARDRFNLLFWGGLGRWIRLSCCVLPVLKVFLLYHTVCLTEPPPPAQASTPPVTFLFLYQNVRWSTAGIQSEKGGFVLCELGDPYDKVKMHLNGRLAGTYRRL